MMSIARVCLSIYAAFVDSTYIRFSSGHRTYFSMCVRACARARVCVWWQSVPISTACNDS